MKIPAAFSYAPSQNWIGNDGSWSSFVVRVGTPPQDFHVFPSTIGQETLVPLPEGCTSKDPSNCGTLRGVLPAFGIQGTGFLPNSSSTWDLVGLYATNLENTLGYEVNAQFGFDTVGLQVEHSGGIEVNRSVVAGIAAKEFYLGSLGLGPQPTNFTMLGDPKPSLIMMLNSSQQIPSTSYGYTAGASYRYSQVLGSLTLGGYDSTRFEPTNLSIPFAGDESRPLQIAVQSITGASTLLGTANLLPTAVYANIDSTLPYFWLPRAACDAFESAFGLTYDNHTDLYLVNDTIHTRLTVANPIITFKLGVTLFNGDFQNIEFPYAAFDLEATYPIYPNATKYFPIRRAANSSQYTLGRAFLQEAYLIADYERKNFTVAQANFSARMPSSHIVPIISPGYNLTSKPSSLSPGTIAGIVVGAVGALAFLALTFFLLRRRRRRNDLTHPHAVLATSDPDIKPPVEEADGYALHELHVSGLRKSELDGETAKLGGAGVQELGGVATPGSELDAFAGGLPPKWVHEAEGSPGPVFELVGSEPRERERGGRRRGA